MEAEWACRTPGPDPRERHSSLDTVQVGTGGGRCRVPPGTSPYIMHLSRLPSLLPLRAASLPPPPRGRGRPGRDEHCKILKISRRRGLS